MREVKQFAEKQESASRRGKNVGVRIPIKTNARLSGPPAHAPGWAMRQRWEPTLSNQACWPRRKLVNLYDTVNQNCHPRTVG